MPFLIHGPDDPTTVNQVEIFLLAAMSGLVVESCANALLLLHSRQRNALSKQKKTELFVPLLLLINNAANIIYNLTSLSIFYNEAVCGPMARICNVSSHVLFLTSNVFVLYTAYVISNYHVLVRNISHLLLLHRLGWALYDIYESYGFFDNDNRFCEYIQHSISAYYSTGDIASDCFATLVIVVVAVVRLGGTTNVSLGLIQRNFLRSLVIVGTSVVAVYTGVNWVNQFWLGCGYAFQSYVLARAVNVDLMYDESLSERLEKKSMLQSVLLTKGVLSSGGGMNIAIVKLKRDDFQSCRSRPERRERPDSFRSGKELIDLTLFELKMPLPSECEIKTVQANCRPKL